MKKLELNHLAPYLPYGLRVSSLHTLHARNGIGNISHVIKAVNEGKSQYKPILRPLSDLTKEIEHNGERFVPIEEWNWGRFDEISTLKPSTLRFIQLQEYDRLIEYHFDVFGLIEKGLAIDINTSNEGV